MISTLEELRQVVNEYHELESHLKDICAEFMEGCMTDCVHDMQFNLEDSYCYLTWEEDVGYDWKMCERKIPLDWLIKPFNEVRSLIWDILEKERKREENKKKKEERLKQKAKEDEERKVYEELKKKFERKKK